MILEHGVSDDDATVWVVVLWFEFDLYNDNYELIMFDGPIDVPM